MSVEKIPVSFFNYQIEFETPVRLIQQGNLLRCYMLEDLHPLVSVLYDADTGKITIYNYGYASVSMSGNQLFIRQQFQDGYFQGSDSNWTLSMTMGIIRTEDDDEVSFEELFY